VDDVPEAADPPRYVGLHRAPRSPAWWAALVAVSLALVLTATLLIVRPWADDAAGGSPPRTATDVVRWIQREVPDSTPVTAPVSVRSALGPAADRLSDGSPDGALQVVEGEPDSGALVLARFGDALSVIDPDPASPAAAELDRRRTLAEAVLANPVAGVEGRAADLLHSGNVDARLLGLLAGLVSRMDVHVADLPPAPGEPATGGPPARRVLLDEAGGERLTPGAVVTDELVAYLEAQRAPFAPASVEETEQGVLVAFRYASAPDDLVRAAGP
jgi:hypothetical protein